MPLKRVYPCTSPRGSPAPACPWEWPAPPANRNCPMCETRHAMHCPIRPTRPVLALQRPGRWLAAPRCGRDRDRSGGRVRVFSRRRTSSSIRRGTKPVSRYRGRMPARRPALVADCLAGHARNRPARIAGRLLAAADAAVQRARESRCAQCGQSQQQRCPRHGVASAHRSLARRPVSDCQSLCAPGAAAALWISGLAQLPARPTIVASLPRCTPWPASCTSPPTVAR